MEKTGGSSGNPSLAILLGLTFSLMLSGGLLLFVGLTNIRDSDLLVYTDPVSSEIQTLGVATATLEGEFVEAKVTKIIDGDTIDVQIASVAAKVRYIGIDTPETVDPRRPDGCFGKQASDKNKELVLGKTVLLAKDISERDSFGRLLRFVYLPQAKNIDGSASSPIFVNQYLVAEGFARAKNYPPDVSKKELFKQAEILAMDQKKGLWSVCQSLSK